MSTERAPIQGVWLDTPRMKPKDVPAPPPLSESFRADARALIAKYPAGRERSALLPLLYLVQSEHGYVSSDGIDAIADLLGLTKAEIAAVSTFYTMFKRRPQGKWLVSVCAQPSCYLAGAREIIARLEELCGISCGDTTADGLLSIEEVECLCDCDLAPVVSINYENFGGASVDDIVGIIQTLMQGEQPPAATRSKQVPRDFKAVSRRMSGVDGPMPRARRDGGA